MEESLVFGITCVSTEMLFSDGAGSIRKVRKRKGSEGWGSPGIVHLV